MKLEALSKRPRSPGSSVIEFIEPGQHAGHRLFTVQSNDRNVDLSRWIAGNRELVESNLTARGAIFFRGFGVEGVSDFQEVVKAMGRALCDYDFASTPRTAIKGQIYSSTEYPADQEIPMHNEMSYTKRWPLNLWFYCEMMDAQGGETPLASSAAVYDNIDADVREAFERKQLLYVRNFTEHLDIPWQQAFRTSSKEEVERYCRERAIDYCWLGDNHLRTKELCQSVMQHPITQRMVWFNQAHLFHVSSLKGGVDLLSVIDQDHLPRNVYYGDGSPIPVPALDHINQVYNKNKIIFQWQPGDVVLVDNILFAHGRHPFKGERKIRVAMTM